MCGRFVLTILFSVELVWGHAGDRVVPIFEITEETLAGINLQDGLIDEWIDLMGDPTLTPVDFVFREPGGDGTTWQCYYEPSDLDYRIWLGWMDSPDRFYLAVVFADDVYYNEYDPEDLSRDLIHYDSVGLFIDADHSGGGFPIIDSDGRHWQDVSFQIYYASAQVPEGHSIRYLLSSEADWLLNPPYGDGGGRTSGGIPAISVVELYVTPFDDLVVEAPERNILSNLVAGSIVGFKVQIHDHDGGGDLRGLYQVIGTSGSGAAPDGFADGLLIGAGDIPLESSAVQADSWGRIKASLSQ